MEMCRKYYNSIYHILNVQMQVNHQTERMIKVKRIKYIAINFYGSIRSKGSCFDYPASAIATCGK